MSLIPLFCASTTSFLVKNATVRKYVLIKLWAVSSAPTIRHFTLGPQYSPPGVLIRSEFLYTLQSYQITGNLPRHCHLQPRARIQNDNRPFHSCCLVHVRSPSASPPLCNYIDPQSAYRTIKLHHTQISRLTRNTVRPSTVHKNHLQVAQSRGKMYCFWHNNEQ